MPFAPDVQVDSLTFDDRALTIYDSDPSSPDRDVIVLVHGTGGTAFAAFEWLLPMLSFKHRVVTFDLLDPREPGELPLPEWYDEQLRQVVAYAASQGPMSIVGYSLGAVIAARFAADHPENLHGLVLIAGWGVTDVQQRFRNRLWERIASEDTQSAAEFSVFTAHSGAYLNELGEAGVAELVRAQMNAPDRRSKMAFNRTVDIGDELSRITAPTLVIGCTHDVMAPIRHSELMFGAIEDARLARVQTGHAAVIERPAELFSLIHDFVSEPTLHGPGAVLQPDHA